MNSSQILGPSSPRGGGGGADFLDLATPQREEHRRSDVGGVSKEQIIPSYDFQPIRTVRSSSLDASRPSWGSVDSSKIASSNLEYAGVLEPHELTKVRHEKERAAYDAATVAEIDHTVKKYADHIMHCLDDVSSKLLQMETRTRHLESSVDDLKVEIGNNNGSTDGKLRQLENILREVQTGIQVLRDKQEIAEAQMQLAKLHTSKGDNQIFDNSNSGLPDTQQLPAPQQQQSVQQSLQQTVPPPQPPSLPAPLAPNAPFPPQQNQPPVQYSGQLPQIPSMNSYLTPPTQSTDAQHQQYQIPPQNQPPTPQSYQSTPQLPQYAQPGQHPQPVNPMQTQPPLPHHPEHSPYMPPQQSYTPNIRQSPSLTQPPSSAPQQFYGSTASMYEPPTGKPSSAHLTYPAGYAPPMGPPTYSEPYPYSESPSHHSSSPVRHPPSPFSSSAASSGGSNNYHRLPTAQMLPQAQPAGPPSGATGNRVPVDDVVDKVATMGFSRDQVRAAVRKLTENGQSVDLNVVLDKLMNDGETPAQKGWFGR